MKRLLPFSTLALLILIWSAQPALAGNGDQAAAGLFGPAIVAFFAYPVGLALHALILAYAPRRGLGLVNKLENHRWKTLILGALNTFFLVLVGVTLKKGAPALSFLAMMLGFSLALIGSHGIARGLGARVLGREPASDAPGDIKETAVGWFVFLFALAIPGLNLLLGPYWLLRATGGVVLTLFSIPADAEGKSPLGDDPDV